MQLQARAFNAGGHVVSGVSFTWSSSADNVATVSSSGSVTAVANGAAAITATTGGISGSASVTVNASVTVTVDATDSGWYDDTGLHVHTRINYVVGNTEASVGSFVDHRNFLVFDLSSISTTVISAILVLNSAQILGVANDPLYTVFDASTPVADLRAGGSGLTAIFNDLGGSSSHQRRTGLPVRARRLAFRMHS